LTALRAERDLQRRAPVPADDGQQAAIAHAVILGYESVFSGSRRPRRPKVLLDRTTDIGKCSGVPGSQPDCRSTFDESFFFAFEQIDRADGWQEALMRANVTESPMPDPGVANLPRLPVPPPGHDPIRLSRAVVSRDGQTGVILLDDESDARMHCLLYGVDNVPGGWVVTDVAEMCGRP
jgi:hypothetical protein